MTVVIACKSDQNHENQRNDGEDNDSDNGESQQERMQVFLLQGPDIIHKSRNLLPFLSADLSAVGTFGGHAGEENHTRCQHKSDDAVEQAQHGVVASGVLIDPQGLIVDLTLFHRAQGDKITDGADAESKQKDEIQYFQCQENQSPDHLFIQNVSKAEHQKGKPGDSISFLHYLQGARIPGFIKFGCSLLLKDSHL